MDNSEIAKLLGAQGGKKTLEKYGTSHFSDIRKKVGKNKRGVDKSVDKSKTSTNKSLDKRLSK